MTSVRNLPGLDTLARTAAAVQRSASNLFRAEPQPIPGVKPVGKLPEWKVMCQEAKDLAQNGEKEEALMLYHRALRMRPNAPEIKNAIRALTTNITENIQASKTMKLFSTMKLLAHKKKTRKSSITGADLLQTLGEDDRQQSAKSITREIIAIKPASNTRRLPPIGHNINDPEETTKEPLAVPLITLNNELIEENSIDRERIKLQLGISTEESDIRNKVSDVVPGSLSESHGREAQHTPEPTHRDNPPGPAHGSGVSLDINSWTPSPSPTRSVRRDHSNVSGPADGSRVSLDIRSARRGRSSKKRKKDKVIIPTLTFRSLHGDDGGDPVSRQGEETEDRLENNVMIQDFSGFDIEKGHIDSHADSYVKHPQPVTNVPAIKIKTEGDQVDNSINEFIREEFNKVEKESANKDLQVISTEVKQTETQSIDRVKHVQNEGQIETESGASLKALNNHSTVIPNGDRTFIPPKVIISEAEDETEMIETHLNDGPTRDSEGSEEEMPTTQKTEKESEQQETKGKSNKVDIPFTTKRHLDRAKSFYKSPRVPAIHMDNNSIKKTTKNNVLPGIILRDIVKSNATQVTRPGLKRSSTTITDKPRQVSTLRKTSSLKSLKKESVVSRTPRQPLQRSSTTISKPPAAALPPITKHVKSTEKEADTSPQPTGESDTTQEEPQKILGESQQGKESGKLADEADNSTEPREQSQERGHLDSEQEFAQPTHRSKGGMGQSTNNLTVNKQSNKMTPRPLVRSKTSTKLASSQSQNLERSVTSLQFNKNKPPNTKENDPVRKAVLSSKADLMKESEKERKNRKKSITKATYSTKPVRGKSQPRGAHGKVELQKKLEEEKGMPLKEMPEDVQREFQKSCARAMILAKSNVALTMKAAPRPDSRTADWHQEAPEFLLETTQRLEVTDDRPLSPGSSPRGYALAELKRIQTDYDEERFEKARYRCKIVLEKMQEAQLSEDFTELDKQNVLANLYSLQGNACLDLGEIEEALDAHLKDLGIGTDFGLLDAKSRGLSNVGRVHARAGRYRDAIDVWGDKVALCVSAEERAWLFHEMGRCYFEMSEYADAQELADKSCVNAQETNNTDRQFQACYLLAKCYNKLQAFEEALIEYNKALDLAVVSDNEEEVERIEDAIHNLNAQLASRMVDTRLERQTRARLARMRTEDEKTPVTARGIDIFGDGKSSPTSDLYYMTLLYVMATLPEY